MRSNLSSTRISRSPWSAPGPYPNLISKRQHTPNPSLNANSGAAIALSFSTTTTRRAPPPPPRPQPSCSHRWTPWAVPSRAGLLQCLFSARSRSRSRSTTTTRARRWWDNPRGKSLPGETEAPHPWREQAMPPSRRISTPRSTCYMYHTATSAAHRLCLISRAGVQPAAHRWECCRSCRSCRSYMISMPEIPRSGRAPAHLGAPRHRLLTSATTSDCMTPLPQGAMRRRGCNPVC